MNRYRLQSTAEKLYGLYKRINHSAEDAYARRGIISGTLSFVNGIAVIYKAVGGTIFTVATAQHKAAAV